MTVTCEWCEQRPGRWFAGAWLCDPCRDARAQLDDCPAAGITRPTEEALHHAEQLLTRALPFTP